MKIARNADEHWVLCVQLKGEIAGFSFSCTLAGPTPYLALFKAQEDGVFTATCHTSKTRLSEKFEIRFRTRFRLRQRPVESLWHGG